MDLILKKIKKIKKDIEYPTSYISNNLDSDRGYCCDQKTPNRKN